MMRVVKTLGGLAAVMGAAMLVAPVSAEAKCQNCKFSSTKVNTSYSSKTAQKVSNVTRYKDVNNTRHVTHTQRIVNVTRIQPINRVNVVTRVHNRTMIQRENQNVAQTKMLPGRTETFSGGTQQLGSSAGSDRTSTVYRYNTVQKVNNVTQYRDVNNTKWVKHIHRHVSVTNVQPITRVKMITRVHNSVVVRNRTENVAQTAMLPAKTITTGKTMYINHKPAYGSCGC